MPDDLTPQQLDWLSFVRQGEYRSALAAARLGHAPEELQGALEHLFDLQEAVRVRQYGEAQRHFKRLEDLAATTTAQPLADLWPSVDVEQLSAGLSSLQASAQQRPPTDGSAEADTQQLQAALACPLTRAEALNVLGVRAAARGEAQQAQSHFEQAQAADPRHYRAISNLGNLALERGDLQAAADFQRQAVALNDEFATGHHNLGVVLRKQGKLSESVKHIKRSQRLSLRQAQQQDQRGSPWQNPQMLRIVGLVLAALVFFWFMRGHH